MQPDLFEQAAAAGLAAHPAPGRTPALSADLVTALLVAADVPSPHEVAGDTTYTHNDRLGRHIWRYAAGGTYRRAYATAKYLLGGAACLERAELEALDLPREFLDAEGREMADACRAEAERRRSARAALPVPLSDALSLPLAARVAQTY